MSLSNANTRRIQEFSVEYFDGKMEPAFKMWALECILADAEPSADELFKRTAVDMRGDLGLDGFWFDEDGSRLVLLQSKAYGKARRIPRPPLEQLRSTAQTLRNVEYATAHGNKIIRDAIGEIYDALLDDDIRLELYFVTSSDFTQGALDYARGPGSAPWEFAEADTPHVKEIVMRAMTAEDLERYKRDLIAGAAVGQTPLAEIPVPRERKHEVPGKFKCIRATVEAEGIVSAYHGYRDAIFRLNPRGALTNKVNDGIRATVRDPYWRDFFHIVNNGLTIVCDSFVYDEQREILRINDFQIVNGCQTTYNLWLVRTELVPTVLVNINVIESPGIANRIATTTNSQSAMKAEDFASMDPVHDALIPLFAALDPPWLYEKRRGEFRLKKTDQQKLDKAKFKDRKLSLKDAAQWGLSFSGDPSMAKYDLKQMLSRSSNDGRKSYGAVFDGKQPEQILLPVVVGRRVAALVEAKASQLEESSRMTSWIVYSRMHLVGLVGEWLRVRHGESDNRGLLTLPHSRLALNSIESWLDTAFAQALEAVEYIVDVAYEAEQFTNVREFFRSDDRFNKMTARLRARFQGNHP